MEDRSGRAVVYARKSVKDEKKRGQSEQSESIETQIEVGRRYAQDRGWTVVDVFDDDGKRGSLDRENRPGLDKALTLVESGQVDYLITLWTNRLSRNMQQWIEYLDVLEQHNVEWHATAEGGLVDRRTAMTRLMTTQRAAWAEYQSDLIRENWQRAHDGRIQRGLPKTTSRRFGYRYDADSQQYLQHDAEADVVAEMYRRYVDERQGFQALVTWLNGDGWRTSAGHSWSVRTLSRFMDSGFAAGLISRETHLRDKKGSHKPILEDNQWEAYMARRAKQRELGRKASGSGERWWLAGLVKCALCGGPTYVDSFKRPDGKSSVMCSNHRSAHDRCEKGVTILRTYVEGVVGLWLGPHLDALDVLRGGVDDAAASTAAAAYATAVADRDKIRDALAQMEVDVRLGDLDRNVYEVARAKMHTRLDAAEAQVRSAAEALHAPAEDTAAVRQGRERGWDAAGRVALAGVLERVEVGPDTVTVVPVTGEPVVWSRSSLTPRCGIADCGRKRYTRGLCKSHVMRARSIGGDELLAALSDRVGEDQPSITVQEVESILAIAAEGST